MKKILLVLVGVMVMGIQSVTAYTPQIALQHNGSVTQQFEATQLQDAFNAAVNGDTIYLSAGTFSGSYPTIKTAITVIGAGAESTVINCTVFRVSIPDSPQLTAHLLDGLRINGNLSFNRSITGAKIRKCKIGNVFFYDYDYYYTIFDRCSIQYLVNNTFNRLKINELH